jgi:hypothetical protein
MLMLISIEDPQGVAKQGSSIIQWQVHLDRGNGGRCGGAFLTITLTHTLP